MSLNIIYILYFEIAAPVCVKDLLLYYPFDEDVDDHSCSKAKSTTVGKVVLSSGKRSKAAYFDGTCRIEVSAVKTAHLIK